MLFNSEDDFVAVSNHYNLIGIDKNENGLIQCPWIDIYWLGQEWFELLFTDQNRSETMELARLSSPFIRRSPVPGINGSNCIPQPGALRVASPIEENNHHVDIGIMKFRSRLTSSYKLVNGGK